MRLVSGISNQTMFSAVSASFLARMVAVASFVSLFCFSVPVAAVVADLFPFFPIQRQPLGMVPSNTTGCVYVIFPQQISYVCSSGTILQAVTRKQLGIGKIAAWANRAGPDNALFFAVNTGQLFPPVCPLFSVSGSGVFRLRNVGMSVSINGALTYRSGARDMLMSSWDSLFVLGGANGTFGLYEVFTNNTFSIITQLSAPSALTIREPFFVEWNKTVAFRGFDLSTFNIIGTWDSVTRTIRRFTPDTADTQLIGPALTFTQPAFFHFQPSAGSDTAAKVCFVDGASPNCSAVVTVPGTFWDPVTSISGLVANADVLSYFSDRSRITGSPAVSPPTLSSTSTSVQIMHDGNPASPFYTDDNTEIRNLDSNIIGSSFHNLRPVTLQSIVYLSAVSGSMYAVQVMRNSGAVNIIPVSSCLQPDSGSSPNLPALAVSDVPGPGWENNVAITAISRNGTCTYFYDLTLGTWTSVGSLHPILPMNGRSGGSLSLPHSARVAFRTTPNVIILSVLSAVSDSYVPVVAYKNIMGAWTFSWVLDDDLCTNGQKKSFQSWKISSDETIGLVSVYNQPTTAYWAYLFPPANASATIPLNLEWAIQDLQVGIPVLFNADSSITILGRPVSTDPLVLYQFTSTGEFLNTTQLMPLSIVDHLTIQGVSGGLMYFLFQGSPVQLMVTDGRDYRRTGAECTIGCVLTRIGVDSLLLWGDDANITVVANGVLNATTFAPNGTRVAVSGLGPSANSDVGSFVVITEVFQFSLYTYYVYLFEKTEQKNFATVPPIFQQAQVIICGSWRYGVVFALQTGIISYFHYNVSSNVATPFATDNAFGCKQIGGLPRFLLTLPQSHMFVDFSTSPWTIRNVSSTAAGSFIGASDIIEPIGPRTGLALLATVRISEPETVDEVIIIPTDRCFDDSHCNNTASCTNGFCVVPFGPIQAPQGSTQLQCSGSPPFPGAVCIDGVWVVQGDVVVNSTVIIVSNTQINGSLIIGSSNATITISGTSTLTVSDCVSLSGSLDVNRPKPDTSQLNASTVVMTFSGYCGGAPTTFNSTRLTFEGQEACAKREDKPTPQYTETSLSLLFSYDRSGCDAATTGLSIGAIAGIVVGAVAFVTIVVVLILVLKFKGVISPFSGRGQSTTHELDS